MEVFHGTTLILETPLVGVGRKNLDFGEGFYLTNIRQQAIDWAQRPINKDKPQYLNCYDLDINEISINNYRYLKFKAYRYENPNNQICMIRQELVDKYLVFKKAILLNNGK